MRAHTRIGESRFFCDVSVALFIRSWIEGDFAEGGLPNGLIAAPCHEYVMNFDDSIFVRKELGIFARRKNDDLYTDCM